MLFNEALIRDIDQCRLSQGQCAFWWLGQMGYVIRTATKTLYFDLFLSDSDQRRFPSPLRPGLVANADVVFGSHDHLDHIDDPVWQAIARTSEKTRFVLPAGLAKPVSERLGIAPQRLLGIREGDRLNVDGVDIRAVSAAHEVLDDRDEHEIFAVAVDGVTLCHLGDTCVYDGLIAKLKALGPIDVLMLPINGRDATRLFRNCIGNMTYQEAVDLVGEVRPRLAVPGHYDMMEGNTENALLFTAYLEIKYPERDFWIGPHCRRTVFPGA